MQAKKFNNSRGQKCFRKLIFEHFHQQIDCISEFCKEQQHSFQIIFFSSLMQNISNRQTCSFKTLIVCSQMSLGGKHLFYPTHSMLQDSNTFPPTWRLYTIFIAVELDHSFSVEPQTSMSSIDPLLICCVSCFFRMLFVPQSYQHVRPSQKGWH